MFADIYMNFYPCFGMGNSLLTFVQPFEIHSVSYWTASNGTGLSGYVLKQSESGWCPRMSFVMMSIASFCIHMACTPEFENFVVLEHIEMSNKNCHFGSFAVFSYLLHTFKKLSHSNWNIHSFDLIHVDCLSYFLFCM